MDVYVVMEWGDDYHGRACRPVCVFTNEDKAESHCKECYADQVSGCGLKTCDHKYRYVVHKIPMYNTSGV